MRLRSLVWLLAGAVSGCSPVDLYHGIHSSVWTPEHLKELCQKDAGYHAYRTVQGRPGLYLPDHGRGCDGRRCPWALFYGLGYVEVENDGEADAEIAAYPAGIYRISVQPIGHPNCKKPLDWVRTPAGFTGLPRGSSPKLCLAYQRVPAIMARYELTDWYEKTTPEQATADIRQTVIDVRDHQTGEVLGRAIQYAYLGDRGSTGIPDMHICPTTLRQTYILGSVFPDTLKGLYKTN